NLNRHWAKQLAELDPATRSSAVQAPPGLPNIRAESLEYPVVTDPIGPLRKLELVAPEPTQAQVPVFAALPTDEDD
ncbi:MAG: hypothetical protein AB7K71_26175, partial [Polyangiaceae bacterium]